MLDADAGTFQSWNTMVEVRIARVSYTQMGCQIIGTGTWNMNMRIADLHLQLRKPPALVFPISRFLHLHLHMHIALLSAFCYFGFVCAAEVGIAQPQACTLHAAWMATRNTVCFLYSVYRSVDSFLAHPWQ
jgi:hypothetical protein